MTTKPKLKEIPLSNGLKPLPKGAVYLGKIPVQGKRFAGWNYCNLNKEWILESAYAGGFGHYAAPADSEIARRILGTVAKPAKAEKSITKPSKTITKPVKLKKAVTKKPALRPLPKNVKPGTRVVLFDAEGCGRGYNQGDEFTTSFDDGRTLMLKDQPGTWGRHRFRLAPPKRVRKPLTDEQKAANKARREARKTQKIGVMLAPVDPALARYNSECEKFGVAFATCAADNNIDLPYWLTALPYIPRGFHRLEPRGFAWRSDSDCVFFCCSKNSPEWGMSSGMNPAGGCKNVFYIEAVRDEQASDTRSLHVDAHLQAMKEGYVIDALSARLLASDPLAPQYKDSAVGLLNEAAETIGARAAERDVDSERSMAKCVAAFNAMFGKDITEEQGWRFMELLKMSRSTVGRKRDDYLDGAAYCTLAGETALKNNPPA